MSHRVLFLSATLGLVLLVAGCATPNFVRGEVERSAAGSRSAVDRLARDVQAHRTGTQELAIMVAEVGRSAEGSTRDSIEALGVADVAASRAAEAVDRVTLVLTRADEAGAVADQALAQADRTGARLTHLWNRRARLTVVEASVLRFEVDSWILDDQARATALELVNRLQQSPALVVQLEGYADGAGAQPHNLRLSQLRAHAVARFLVEHGVEVHRLQAIGLGSARPVADNGTREGRRQNRRVVVRLLEPS
jgi:outer membrane protein OmpA-like peptidoglycan-associated protein